MDKIYGENIFKAIVESHDERFFKELNEYKNSVQNQAAKDFIYPLGGGMSQEKLESC